MNETIKLVVLVAMDKEVRLLLEAFTDYDKVEGSPFAIYRVRTDEGAYVIIESGIAKANAAAATAYAISEYPQASLLNWGVAGGLMPESKVGDLCVGLSYAYHDVYCGDELAYGQVQGMPQHFDADPSWLKRVQAVLTTRQVHYGVMLTGDQFVPRTEQLRAIVAQAEGTVVSVDMESAAMAQVAYRWQKPFISLRMISDTPLADVDHFDQYLQFWKQPKHQLSNFLVPLLKELTKRQA